MEETFHSRLLSWVAVERGSGDIWPFPFKFLLYNKLSKYSKTYQYFALRSRPSSIRISSPTQTQNGMIEISTIGTLPQPALLPVPAVSRANTKSIAALVKIVPRMSMEYALPISAQQALGSKIPNFGSCNLKVRVRWHEWNRMIKFAENRWTSDRQADFFFTKFSWLNS